jgi:dTDP-4-amino-4,6-dideoxygalactose transaminase
MELKVFEPKLWLATPTMHGDEQRYVQEAFHTNWVSTVGANLDELEKGICRRLGCKYAVALSAGTAALHLAVRLAGVKPGEKVFCTDMTFAASVNPVAYEKGELVFIDSEYETWNMDPVALERAFEKYPEVRVVIVVHLYGTPAKMDEIRQICEKHNAIIIEDAAESLGATYKGVETGTFGNFNAISFNGNKIITTSGGGMLLTDSQEAAMLARKWSTQAREPAPWYQHTQQGYNYRLSNILAGIGRGQLLHLDEHLAAKKAIYTRYQEGFRDLPVAMNPYIPDIMEPNFWLSCMVIHPEAMCHQERSDLEASYVKEPGKTCPTEILEKLAAYNAEGRPIWKPMHMQPIYAENDFITAQNGVCVSEDVFARGLCLPSDIKMTREQQDMVIAIVRSCFA